MLKAVVFSLKSKLLKQDIDFHKTDWRIMVTTTMSNPFQRAISNYGYKIEIKPIPKSNLQQMGAFTIFFKLQSFFA